MERRLDAHAIGEERSLAMHRVIAGRLTEDPDLLRGARERVRSWLAEGTVARPYAERWLEILERPIDEIADFLTDTSEDARTMRSVSPFAGCLGARERWGIHRAVGAAHRARVEK